MKRPIKKIELPIIEPLYSTYHYQGPGTAVLMENPSIRNWYFSQAIILTCTRKFLNGFTTPEIGVAESSWNANPHFDKIWYNMQFLEGHTHFLIRKLLDEGYYVLFNGIDDYYVEGKSWYHQRHFSHDGCICGYNQEDRTYCIYAYDQNWIYQKFWTTQKSFEAGRRAQFKQGKYGIICGIRPKKENVAFSHETALEKIADYLDSNMEKYPEIAQGKVLGIIVHDYIAKYIGKLYDESIPYEKIDRRIFRMIWEHKKCMYDRIHAVEAYYRFGYDLSDEYKEVVNMADRARIVYAMFIKNKRKEILKDVKELIEKIQEKETDILNRFIKKTEEKF